MTLVTWALRDLDLRIEVEASPDGRAVMLIGEVKNKAAADRAQAVAEQALRAGNRRPGAAPVEVLNLLRFQPEPALDPGDERLQRSLRDIDSRIVLRRIQVGPAPNQGVDSFLLEGTVRTVEALQRAVTLADRHLGGTGARLRAVQPGDERLGERRQRARPAHGERPAPNALPAHVARGLVVTSESGRVLSFLRVEELPQILMPSGS